MLVEIVFCDEPDFNGMISFHSDKLWTVQSLL
jgi:hypothetical protein